jgi:uncharacterized protein (DUF1800 family)
MADIAAVTHLLRRTEFIARPARVAELVALPTIDDAADDVLNFGLNNNPQVPVDLQVHNSSMGYQQRIAAYNWWLDSMVSRPRPFLEKMTLFWHGHFVSEWDVVGATDFMTRQNQLYRTHAIGNFLTLTHQMSFEPAMLLYLSNAVNVRTAPNENFARELLELFTLGVGNYTEDDVLAATRAWTGHNYNSTTRSYEFRPTRHDNDLKTFFGTTRNWDGPDIINEVLRDNPAKRLVAARFIARKLWEFLAYPRPAADIVNALGDVFVANNLEIRSLVRAILVHPEFYSDAARNGLVRTPTEWVVALMAYSGLTSSAINVFSYSEQMGQRVFDPPNVAGWKGNSYWLTTSALSGRAAVASRVASLMRANGGYDHLSGMSATDAVAAVAAAFGLDPLPAPTAAALAAAYTAERSASNGSMARANTSLLVMMMLTSEMNVV